MSSRRRSGVPKSRDFGRSSQEAPDTTRKGKDMRLNSKLKAACLAGVAAVATLAADEALAGGRGGGRGGWGGGGRVISRPVTGDHWGGRSSVGYRAGVGRHAYGSAFASEHALNRAYHGRYGGYGGSGGGDYWGGYYGGGGVYYGDWTMYMATAAMATTTPPACRRPTAP